MSQEVKQNSNSIRFIFENGNLNIIFKIGDTEPTVDNIIVIKHFVDTNSISTDSIEKLKTQYKTFKDNISSLMGGGAPTIPSYNNYEQQINELREQIKELKYANEEAGAVQKLGAGSAGGKKKSKTHTVRSKDYFLI